MSFWARLLAAIYVVRHAAAHAISAREQQLYLPPNSPREFVLFRRGGEKSLSKLPGTYRGYGAICRSLKSISNCCHISDFQTKTAGSFTRPFNLSER